MKAPHAPASEEARAKQGDPQVGQPVSHQGVPAVVQARDQEDEDQHEAAQRQKQRAQPRPPAHIPQAGRLVDPPGRVAHGLEHMYLAAARDLPPAQLGALPGERLLVLLPQRERAVAPLCPVVPEHAERFIHRRERPALARLFVEPVLQRLCAQPQIWCEREFLVPAGFAYRLRLLPVRVDIVCPAVYCAACAPSCASAIESR